MDATVATLQTFKRGSLNHRNDRSHEEEEQFRQKRKCKSGSQTSPSSQGIGHPQGDHEEKRQE